VVEDSEVRKDFPLLSAPEGSVSLAAGGLQTDAGAY